MLHQGCDRDVWPAKPQEIQQNRLRVLKLQKVPSPNGMVGLNPEHREDLGGVRVWRQEGNVLDATSTVGDRNHRREGRPDRET